MKLHIFYSYLFIIYISIYLSIHLLIDSSMYSFVYSFTLIYFLIFLPIYISLYQIISLFIFYFGLSTAQVVFCALAGYTTGACATLQTVMCVSLFGPGQMKYAYPGVILAVGIAMLTSPPIAGISFICERCGELE